MLVNLLDSNKNPLGLIHPALSRKLLKSNKAKPVFKLCIPKKVFVIRLLDDIYLEEIKEYLKTPELTLGVDPGASKAGFSVVSKEGEVHYASQVEVRNDITSKMKRRSTYRRNRRYRNTRYRKPRFLNRASSRREGRLPPTVKSKLDSHIKEINYIRSIFNISNIVLEEAKFDTHVISEGRKLKNYEYQKGRMYKFETVKAYVRERDNYKCNICKSKGFGSNSKRLEVHHILERSKGGTNSPDNLITLCSECHKKVHSKEITLNKKKLKSKTINATQVDTIISQLKKYLDNVNINISYTNGVRTSLIRRKLKLVKRHHCDAISIALKYKKRYKKITKVKKSCKVVYKKCVSKGDYQLYKGKRSEKKIPVGKILGFRKFDKVKYLGDNKYKNKCYFIKGRMTSGYFVLMDINGEQVKLKPMAKPSTALRIKARGSLLVV